MQADMRCYLPEDLRCHLPEHLRCYLPKNLRCHLCKYLQEHMPRYMQADLRSHMCRLHLLEDLRGYLRQQANVQIHMRTDMRNGLRLSK